MLYPPPLVLLPGRKCRIGCCPLLWCVVLQDKKPQVVTVVGSCLDTIVSYCVPVGEIIDDLPACLDPKNVRTRKCGSVGECASLRTTFHRPLLFLTSGPE